MVFNVHCVEEAQNFGNTITKRLIKCNITCLHCEDSKMDTMEVTVSPVFVAKQKGEDSQFFMMRSMSMTCQYHFIMVKVCYSNNFVTVISLRFYFWCFREQQKLDDIIFPKLLCFS